MISETELTSISLDGLLTNIIFLYYRSTSERHYWKSGQRPPEINFPNLFKLVRYSREISKIIKYPDIAKSAGDLECWLEKHKNEQKVASAEVAVYFEIIDRIFKSFRLGFSKIDVCCISYFELADDIRDISDKFPNIAFDIIEALNCYRLGRYTAAVFHLSRGLESALRGLARALRTGPIGPRVTWQQLTDRVNAKLNNLPTNSQYQKERKRRLALIVVHLNGARIAWRNDVMHPDSYYTLSSAQSAFQNSVLLLNSIFEFNTFSRKSMEKR